MIWRNEALHNTPSNEAQLSKMFNLRHAFTDPTSCACMQCLCNVNSYGDMNIIKHIFEHLDASCNALHTGRLYACVCVCAELSLSAVLNRCVNRKTTGISFIRKREGGDGSREVDADQQLGEPPLGRTGVARSKTKQSCNNHSECVQLSLVCR